MKKILIVSDYLDRIGGIESYIKDLQKVLPNYKIEYFGGKNLTNFQRKIGVITSIFNKKYAQKIEEKIKKFKPDLIWCHSVSRFLGPKVLQKINQFKIPKIITYHDFGYFSPFATKILEEKDIPQNFTLLNFLKKTPFYTYPYVIFKFFKLKKIRKELQKFDFHTVPSKFMKKYVIDHKYGKKENTYVLPNFILKEKIAQRQNIFQDKINFIFFGRIETEKGILAIISFLTDLWELRYKNKEKYKEISSKIRIFIFGNGSKTKELIDTFSGTNINGKDIGIINDLSKDENLIEKIDKNGKFVYYFGQRDFDTIKKFLSFSHYNLVPSIFLETFGLSAAEACANKLINIGYNKPNINSFILPDYLVDYNKPLKNFSKKMFDIIENFNKTKFESESKQSFDLVKDFII